MENQSQPKLIKQINNYVYNTESVIGKGFTSVVYKGRNSHTKQTVAIKVMDVRSAKTEVEKMLIGNEIKALSTVSHDNVINCHEICQTVNNIYVVTEFCQQGNLGDFIKTHGKLKEEQALAMLYYLAQGLHHIHSKGFLHRDIKSTNVLMRNGIPKIADFGFAIPATDAYSKSMYNVGSPLYMSPQAYKKSQYSCGSDTWGLGVIFYEMLIGGAPFKGVDYNTMVSRVASGEMFQSLNVSPFAKNLLSRMICVDMRQRITTNELLTILERNKPNSSIITSPNRREQSPRPTAQSHLSAKNGSHLSQPNISKENSPIKMLPKANGNSIIKSEYSPEFEQRLMLNRLLDSLCGCLMRNCETKQLFPLILRHWRFNYNKLIQLNQQCAEVNESQRKLAEYFEVPEKLPNEPYFRHVLDKVPAESETFCDYTLFWLRVSLKHNEGLLEHLLTTERLDEQLGAEYLRFMKTIRYCQILDYIRNGDGQMIFPTNEVLDWLIKDSKKVTSEGVEYLRAIIHVLTSSE